jgi:hypothetical protein
MALANKNWSGNGTAVSTRCTSGAVASIPSQLLKQTEAVHFNIISGARVCEKYPPF